MAPLPPGERAPRGGRRPTTGCSWTRRSGFLRTGASWRGLPERYGNPDTARKRFSRWCAKGVWGRVLEALGPNPDLGAVPLDSTIVRAHPHAAGGKGARAQALGRSRGGFGAGLRPTPDSYPLPGLLLLTTTCY